MLKRLKRPLRRLVTLSLLAFIVHRVASRGDLASLAATLRSADSTWLVAAATLSALGVALGVLRFRLLLGAAGLRLNLGWLTRVTLEGRFVGAFTPSTAGLDLYRARWAWSCPRSRCSLWVSPWCSRRCSRSAWAE